MKKYSAQFQRFGRSLLLPIGVMAPMGLILGVAGAFAQAYLIKLIPFFGNPIINGILVSMRTIANVVFDNLPLLFAMGVAYGMSKKDKGIAVFSAVIGYVVMLSSMNVWLTVTGQLISEGDVSVGGQAVVLGIQTVNVNVFGGILAGLWGAWATDRFYKLQLPMAFAFFSGRKSVPLITVGCCVVTGLILPFFWQYLIAFFASLQGILISPIFGTAVENIGNRLLIPFGLHHVWNAMMRFTEAGGVYLINGVTYTGYLPAMNEILFNLGPISPYWSNTIVMNRFSAAPQMVRCIFVFPAIGLAMYRSAYKEKKTMAKSIIVTSVLTAFLGNVTEPLEFSFLFMAPGLYLLYATIGAVGSIAMILLNVRVGYLRGTIIDFLIFGVMYQDTNWPVIVIVGIIEAVIMYFVFRWYIIKRNVQTPGRDEDADTTNQLVVDKNYKEIARLAIIGLGGKDYIVNVENCITRLRVDFKDSSLINNDILRDSGCSGAFMPSKGHIHIVYGPMVEFVRNEVDEQLAELRKD